jgi:hypothetical protein
MGAGPSSADDGSPRGPAGPSSTIPVQERPNAASPIVNHLTTVLGTIPDQSKRYAGGAPLEILS